MSAPLRMRDAGQHERAATPLELLFDLCFVVAVAILAKDLHHGLADGRTGETVAAYALLFVPVWWAWMSFTWFATAFDNDDAVHRLLTMAQMVGIVALAATVHRAFGGDLAAFGIAVAALRVPLVLQWLRAAAHDAAHAAFARTYAGGLSVGAVLWVLGTRLDAPGAILALVPAVAVDLATPMFAVRRAPGPVFHPGHIAERYGLFALIVIGESVLALAVALESAVEGEVPTPDLVAVVAAGAAVAFAVWWIYFDALGRDGLTRHRRAAFTWGYGHYVLYAAVAAAGAGVQVQLDTLLHAEEVGARTGIAGVVLPAALALVAIAALQVAANRELGSAPPLLAGAVAAALIVTVDDLRPAGALTLLVAVGTTVAVSRRRPDPEPEDAAV
ncbi:low temperature requirement protein A [Nocardioides sp.]|uniref:low temperature requirement protein A n=1 Tax=Nocardioides sp. TaxID=35761 RepID=UPI003510E645